MTNREKGRVRRKPRRLLGPDDCGTGEGHRYHRLIAGEGPCGKCAVFRCGTEAEYSAHQRYGEPVDDACRQARSAAVKTRRLAKQVGGVDGSAGNGPLVDAAGVVFEEALGPDGTVDPRKVRIHGAAVAWQRHYRIVGCDRPVPSVTTLLKAVHRPELAAWKTRTISDWWLQVPEYLQGMDSREAYGRVKQIPYLSSQLARRRGQETHQALQLLLTATDTPGERASMADSVIGAVLDEHSRGSLLAAVEILNRLDAKVLFSETIIWRHVPDDPTVPSYAGTLDMLLELPPDGEYAQRIGWSGDGPIVAVADLKTGDGVWRADHMQIGAYARASHLVRPDGTVTPMPTVHAGLLVHANPTTRRLIDVNVELAWEQFIPVAREWNNHAHHQKQLTNRTIEYPTADTGTSSDSEREGDVFLRRRREVLRSRLNSLYRKGIDWETLRSLLPARVEDLTGTQIAQTNAALRKLEPDHDDGAGNGHHPPGQAVTDRPKVSHVEDLEGQRETLRSRLNDAHRRGVDQETLQGLLPGDIDTLTLSQIGTVIAKLATVPAPDADEIKAVS